MSAIKQLQKYLKTKPRKFQIDGIKYLCQRKGNGIIADDMGLGKTLQALGFLALYPSKLPVIIVCPANGKYNWEHQIKLHTTFTSVQVLVGTKTYKTDADILIINYSILNKWESYLNKLNPKILILDESHYIKNPTTKRTKSCLRLAKTIDHVIPMTGTPILNSPIDFYTILALVTDDIKTLGTYWNYAFKYCQPKKAFKGRGWKFGVNYRTIYHLKKVISPLYIRRTKKQVLKELPEKNNIENIVQINNRKLYDKIDDGFLEWYNKQPNRNIQTLKEEGGAKLSKLRMLAGEGKLTAIYEWLDTFLDTTKDKVVIFGHHKIVIDSIAEYLKKKKIKFASRRYVKPQFAQEEIVKFQEDAKCRVYLGSTIADGAVITLTAANTVVFAELEWVPALHAQASDRVLRIGQNASSINIYYFISSNTVDELIWKTFERKSKMTTAVLGS